MLSPQTKSDIQAQRKTDGQTTPIFRNASPFRETYLKGGCVGGVEGNKTNRILKDRGTSIPPRTWAHSTRNVREKLFLLFHLICYFCFWESGVNSSLLSVVLQVFKKPTQQRWAFVTG